MDSIFICHNSSQVPYNLTQNTVDMGKTTNRNSDSMIGNDHYERWNNRNLIDNTCLYAKSINLNSCADNTCNHLQIEAQKYNDSSHGRLLERDNPRLPLWQREKRLVPKESEHDTDIFSQGRPITFDSLPEPVFVIFGNWELKDILANFICNVRIFPPMLGHTLFVVADSETRDLMESFGTQAVVWLVAGGRARATGRLRHQHPRIPPSKAAAEGAVVADPWAEGYFVAGARRSLLRESPAAA